MNRSSYILTLFLFVSFLVYLDKFHEKKKEQLTNEEYLMQNTVIHTCIYK